MNRENQTILLLERRPEFLMELQRAVKKSEHPCSVYPVRSLGDAIDYLLGSGNYERRDEFPPPLFLIWSLQQGISSVRHLFPIAKRLARCLPVVTVVAPRDWKTVQASYDFGAIAALAYPVSSMDIDELVERLNRSVHLKGVTR